jgi:CDP-glycerol glycerophosphotransferase
MPAAACSSPIPGADPQDHVPSPPRISVVLPVYRVPEYLRDCLDSVLGQAPEGTEVIAVDDASPDSCGQILDARARLDPRLQVIRLAGNAGPGNARNIGLKSATGDYVWFADADDRLADGALAAVRARLAQDQPDVLLIDYEDCYPGGRTGPSPGGALLRAAPAGPFTLAQQPALINLTMTAWSKVIRRAFLAEIGLPFPPGIHEDVPVTCAVLLSARRISALDRVCYRYRRARRGSFMVTTSDQHFDIFGSYQAVFDNLPSFAEHAGAPVTEAVSTALFGRAIWHYTTILGTGGAGVGAAGAGGLVPRRSRKIFFERMHQDFRRWRPAGYQYPPGARGVKFRLVERNAYRTYSVLEPANQLRVLASRLASRLRG